jgi:DNA-binding helix-hairpin-helix protein with protein kinase domain
MATTVSESFFDVTGAPVRLGQHLHGDRQADFFSLAGDSSRAARIYKRPARDREEKLLAMVANAPPDATHSLCWPQALVYRSDRECCGFLAPRFERSLAWPLRYAFDSALRKKIPTRLTWRSRIRIAMSLCGVMEAVHSRGHVIGDISETNLFVSDATRVTLVECDSIQVKDSVKERVFTIPVANSAMTSPELQRISGEVRREIADDRFMLAVTIFMLLMDGAHPFQGTWHGDGAPPTLEENIVHGRYAYARWGYLAPAENSPPAEILPGSIVKIFERCFIDGRRLSSHRLSAVEWRDELQRLDSQLQTCRSLPHHLYSKHLDHCPWCGSAMALRKDTSNRAGRLSDTSPNMAPRIRPGVFRRLSGWWSPLSR